MMRTPEPGVNQRMQFPPLVSWRKAQRSLVEITLQYFRKPL